MTLDTTVFHAAVRLGATFAVKQHQRRYSTSRGEGLDDSCGSAMLCDLHGAFGQPVPNANANEAAQRDIRQFLADRTPTKLDPIGYDRRPQPFGMARCHSVMVNALLESFCDAN